MISLIPFPIGIVGLHNDCGMDVAAEYSTQVGGGEGVYHCQLGVESSPRGFNI